MTRSRLDLRDKMPAGMEEYLSFNGWHFNKKLCEWAISLLRKKSNDKLCRLKVIPKEEIKEQFEKHDIKIENCVGYDVMYVYHLILSRYYESSLHNDQDLLQAVKDYIDDPNGYDGLPLTRFYADCIGSGRPIMWEDMI